MYIGSLLDKKSPIGVSYKYTLRGEDTPIYPGLLPEEAEASSYDASGKLFSDFIGFEGPKIGHSGVDIHFEFDKECFVDNIVFKLKNFSQIKKVSVYDVRETGERLVGTYLGESGLNISTTRGRVNMNADGTIKYDEVQDCSDAEITVSIASFSKHLIFRMDADYLHLAIGNVNIFGAYDLEHTVYPLPKEFEISDNRLTSITGICVNCDDAKAGAEYFAELSVLENAKLCPDGNIVFDYAPTEDEGFEIEVNQNGAKISASSKRGFIYGAAKLLQLCSTEGIAFAKIKDAPFMEIRGAHVALPSRKDLEFFKRLVKYVYVPLGYNTVILQISAMMEYKRHPKINEAWVEAVENYNKGLWPAPAHYGFLGDIPYTQDEMREICAYIRSFGLEIAAEVQTFGHVQYVTMAYPHLAEPEYSDNKDGDEYGADERPTSFYHHCMCPLHEEYYKVFYDIIDEVVEVINPEKYIHIGHDEIYTYGKCEKCSKVPVEKLFADEVTKMHDYIATKGLKTMMWSDMIVKETYSIPGAIDLIPKDILCLPFTWYFHLDEDTEQILADHGFEYIIGNFYSSHYTRFNKRKATPGWRGAQVSAWVNCSEDVYCYEGKIYEFIYVANMLWNENYFEEARNTYTLLSTKISTDTMKKLRGNFADFSKAQKLDIKKCSKSVPYDIRYEADGAVKAKKGETKLIELSLKANNLWFLQATDKNAGRIPWKKLHSIGHYKINYADKSFETASICYCRDIAEYNRQYAKPLSSPLFRHEGYLATCYSEPVMSKTEAGEDYTLYARPWQNPHPEKEIVSVELVNEGINDASIMLFDIFAD